MAKAHPVGTINERADGSVWAKDPMMDWKQVRDGNREGRPSGPASGGAAVPGTTPAAGATAGTGDANPWSVHQKKYGLDGHLPDPTIHPQHVDIDTEGDIDTKPVLKWQDAMGLPHHSYTSAFHRHRALAQREKIKKVGSAAFRTAHAKLKAGMVTGSTPKARDAAAAAFVHLTGGHRINDILGMHAMHVATTTPAQGGDAPDSGKPDDPVEVRKSATSDPNHRHRTHMVMQHPHGHLYTATHYDDGLADHLRNRVNERAGASALFECGPEDVKGALADAGLGDIDEATMRHHIAHHAAADALSKLQPVSLEPDYASGMAQVIANLAQVSDEIGENWGHDPAPEGMSYVPPTIAAAYVEESGGAKHWPKVFRKSAPETEQQEVEKSVCTSTNVVTDSSSEASNTTSEPLDKTSPSSEATSPPLPRTPTPSPQPSSTEEPLAPPSEPAEQVLDADQETPVNVSLATEDDKRLRTQLHKVLGTQFPSPATAMRKKLAEQALGRAVARARDGALAVADLDRAHQAYKAGDYRGCCQILVSKSGAGSAGSTGSTGRSGDLHPVYHDGQTDNPHAQVSRARHQTGSGGTGAHPGPDGLPIGSMTTLSDGTREQKVGPHEWRRIGSGKNIKAEKPAQKEETSRNPTIDTAMSELERLRQRRKAASSKELQTELDQQIEALRLRIAKLKRGFGKTKASDSAKQQGQQGHTASRPARDQRQTREMAKSVRSATAFFTAAPPDDAPWFEQRERTLAEKFDDFVAGHSTVDMVLINLAKADTDLLVQARSIVQAHGVDGLKRYIAVHIGGPRGA